MKQLSIAIYIALILTSCTQEPQEPAPEGPWWGEASATKNGISWIGKPYAVTSKEYSDRVNISIDSLMNDYYTTKSLEIYRVPVYLGTYRIFDNLPKINDSIVRAKYYFVDYDVLYGTYKVLESDSSSFITVTSYDSVSKEVKGTFDVTLVKEISPGPNAPDTIRFRNGMFHTKVIK
jgi:hypothetical protein